MTFEEEIFALEDSIIERVKGGKIPAEHAAICWNDGDNAQNLQVFDFREIEDLPHARTAWKRADNTAGACLGSWMKGDPRSTPAGVFSYLLTAGLLPDGVQMAWVLSAFADIEGCDWAEQMLAAFLEQAKGEVWR